MAAAGRPIGGTPAGLEWLPEQGRAEQLILLLHGHGGDARAMAPLAQALRGAFAQAAVVAPSGPFAADAAAQAASGAGPRQWYAVEGLTPQNWPLRVAACMPALLAWVRAQQQRLGVAAPATLLGGFSQGAVLALAAVLHEDGSAGRVLAFGGGLAAQPASAPRHSTVHLLHGADDRVIPAERARQALQWLGECQGDATLDIAAGVGHELHPALIGCALQRLQSHIPLRTWQAGLGAAPAPPQA